MSVNFNDTYKDFYNIIGTSPKVQKTNDTSALVRVGDVNSDDRMSKTKMFGIIGASVGTVAILALFILSIVSKGFSSGFAKKFAAISDKLKNSLYDLTTNSKNLTVSQKIKLNVIKLIQPIMDILQAWSNVTAIKDSFSSHLLKKMHLEPVIKSINKFFKNIVLKTKNNSYHESELAMVSFCNNLKRSNNPELIKKAEEIQNQYFQYFSSAAHLTRTDDVWHKMKNLDKNVYEILFKDHGLFKNLKKYTKYITTDIVSADKIKLQKSLRTSKSLISNSIEDVYTSLKQALYGIKTCVNPENKEIVSVIDNLTKKIEAYRNLEKTVGSVKEQSTRANLFEEIKQSLEKLVELSKSDAKNPVILNDKIKIMQEAITPEMTQKGLAQEALALVKEQYGKTSEEYISLKDKLGKMNSKLNTAINWELSSFDKLAELRVGSAPTDILGILGPAVLATFLVVDSKDKQERISNTLLKGIPILGAIGTSFYGNTRQFTGAKNLALALTTGSILNMIGSAVNNEYKKYVEKQKTLKEAYASYSAQLSEK